MPDLLRHLQGLAGKEPARYMEAAARGYSHQVWREPFRTCPPGRWPWVVLLGLALAGGAAAWWRPDVALPLTLLAAASLLVQAGGWLRLGRLLPWRSAANLVAVIPSVGLLRHRVVLVVPCVPCREGCGPEWLASGRERWLMGAAGAAVLLMPVLAGVRLFLPGRLAGWGLLFCLLAVGAAGLLLTLRELSAETGDKAVGNLGGAAAGLYLGDRFAQRPLWQTEVWTVFTGCQEGGLHALLDRHRLLLADAHLIILECTVPGGPPRYQPESGVLPGLARAVAAGHPEWGFRGEAFWGYRSLALAAVRRGCAALAVTAGAGQAGAQAVAGFAGALSQRIDQVEP